MGVRNGWGWTHLKAKEDLLPSSPPGCCITWPLECLLTGVRLRTASQLMSPIQQWKTVPNWKPQYPSGNHSLVLIICFQKQQPTSLRSSVIRCKSASCPLGKGGGAPRARKAEMAPGLPGGSLWPQHPLERSALAACREGTWALGENSSLNMLLCFKILHNTYMFYSKKKTIYKFKRALKGCHLIAEELRVKK